MMKYFLLATIICSSFVHAKVEDQRLRVSKSADNMIAQGSIQGQRLKVSTPDGFDNGQNPPPGSKVKIYERVENLQLKKK